MKRDAIKRTLIAELRAALAVVRWALAALVVVLLLAEIVLVLWRRPPMG